MKKINNIHVVDSPYWAGEHSFTHYANQCVNDRNDYTDLWAVDIYNRNGLNPLQHHERHYIWANADAESAVDEAIPFIKEGAKTFITHIMPLNERLCEPA